jgi:hypothetical protein
MEQQISGDSTLLMRPSQVAEAKEELAQIEATLNAPPHIRGRISDPRMMQKRRQSLRNELDKNAPRAYAKSELDAAIKEYNSLSDFIAEGMPSNATMRRNPAGAVGQHISWEKRTEKAVLRYKHIGLRLLATGAVPDNMKHGTDISSVERLRKLDGDNDSMEGAQIPKVRDYHIGRDVARSVIFKDEEIAIVQQMDPEIAEQLAVLDADQRAIVKKHIQDLLHPPAAAQPQHEEALANWAEIVKKARDAGIKSYGRKREDVVADLVAAGISV